MNLEKIIILALVGTIFIVLLKKEIPYISIVLPLLIGVLIFLELLTPIREIFILLQEVSVVAGISSGYFGIVWKVIGIAYLTQFAVQICSDSGESSLGGKVELAGKVCIMASSAPILTTLLYRIIELI